ncbi:MAG: diaminopimelate decarboxylase [Acidocella sp.]
MSTRKVKVKMEERPPAFVYRGVGTARALHCEQVELARLAGRHGTPLYVYSTAAIRASVQSFQKALARQSHTVCYSVKANSNLNLLRLLAGLGCGFDVVSGGELERVLSIGPEAAAGVVFSGVGKTAVEMDLALKAGILIFNVESAAELELLATRAARLKKTARVAIRVNPDVEAKTHPYISTGLRQHKFGVPISQARELYRRAAGKQWLDPVGVSVHIGSQITDVKPFGETMERVLTLIRQLRQDGLNISFVDAGGGLGIRYQNASPTERERSIRHYAQALMRPLRGSGVHLLLEPGRSIVAAAGVLITRALYAKENGGKQFLVVDAAMNDLIRPSLYGAHHEIVPLHPRVTGKNTVEGAMDVVGPICETGDFFALERELPSVAPGDYLAILDAGAYGMAQSSNYNSRPRAAEVMVEGRKARLIRRRETMADLLATETV